MRKYYRKSLFLFLCLAPILRAQDSESELLSKKVDAHLIIGDTCSALKEAIDNVERFPESALAHEMLLRSLAIMGDDAHMMKEWSYITEKFPKCAQKRELLEQICLGILKKGCESESLTTRLIGFLAIAQSQLPDAVDIIKKGMNDSNAQLRALNVELAAVYRDYPLIEEIKNLFYREKNIEVRVSVVKAIASLKLTSMVPELIQSLEKNPKMATIEKRETIAAIAGLREEISYDELQKMLTSGRAWQVALASSMIRKWHLTGESDLLWPLVTKGTTEGRVEALKTLGFLQSGHIPLFYSLCKDSNPLIGITASWALAFLEPSSIEENFSYWLKADQSKVRAMAASALMVHGKRAVPFAKKILKESEDLFVRANLSLHLLKLRIDVEENAQILYDFLRTTKEKLMWVGGNFPYVYESTLGHSPLIANQPEAVNQSVRLEILNLLAIVEFNQAETAIREFLKESRWEIAGLAAETLLQEGDESALVLVRGLLEDPDKQIQTQAAFMLSIWGKDPAAMTKLMALYENADRTLKIKILESIGFIGDDQAIPFLIERLKEPSGIFRMVAACVLLRTLYH